MEKDLYQHYLLHWGEMSDTSYSPRKRGRVTEPGRNTSMQQLNKQLQKLKRGREQREQVVGEDGDCMLSCFVVGFCLI